MNKIKTKLKFVKSDRTGSWVGFAQVQLASAKLRNMFVKFFFGCRKSKFFSWSEI